MSSSRFVLLLPALALAACSFTVSTPKENLDLGSTEQHAVVSQQQATTAFEIARGIDYLPWGYTNDGCYARGLYMSMEIAARGIPTSAQYLQANSGASLNPGGGVTWGWHVAPMVKVGAEGTPTIIDPALFAAPEVARSLDAWVARSNPLPAGEYTTSLVPGSVYRTFGDRPLITTFADLPSFQMADVEAACDTAYNYLELEAPAPAADALAAKRARLISRTVALLPQLLEREKIDGYVRDQALRCGPAPQAPSTPPSADPPSPPQADPEEPTPDSP